MPAWEDQIQNLAGRSLVGVRPPTVQNGERTNKIRDFFDFRTLALSCFFKNIQNNIIIIYQEPGIRFSGINRAAQFVDLVSGLKMH